MQKKPSTENNLDVDLEYSSLSELVEAHLSLVNKSENKNEIENITDGVSKLTLPTAENNREKIAIDLTAALTKTTVKAKPSQPKKEKQQEAEKPFEIPFVDCEIEVAQPTDVLECKMDISDVLFLKCNYLKGASEFGKVLCRRYKRTIPYTIHFSSRMHAHTFKVFDFTTPSPDDVILSCLKKSVGVNTSCEKKVANCRS